MGGLAASGVLQLLDGSNFALWKLRALGTRVGPGACVFGGDRCVIWHAEVQRSIPSNVLHWDSVQHPVGFVALAGGPHSEPIFVSAVCPSSRPCSPGHLPAVD